MSQESVEYLLKHPGSCSGMFWRHRNATDPKGGTDWPRNGSVLKGVMHSASEVNEKEDWLEVSAWKQAGSDTWIENCSGLWMPSQQGGQLLHKVEK